MKQKLLLFVAFLLAVSLNAHADWIVAGQSAIMNNNADWDPSATANKMTNVSGNYWKLVVSNKTLSAGTYEYKVTNGTWGEAYPSNNAQMNVVAGTYNILFTFNSSTKDVNSICFCTVVGNNADLFGTTWAPTASANNMTQESDYTFTKTYSNVSLSAGTIEYKVALNGTWDTAYPGSNQSLTIPNTGAYNVTFTYNPFTNSVSATATEVIDLYLTGSFNSWNTSDATAKFTDNLDGTFTFTKHLSGGDEIKFIDSNATWYGTSSSYNLTNSVTDLALTTSNGQNITIKQSGNWTFVVTPNGTSSKVTATVVPDPFYLYLIGSPMGWSADNNYKFTDNNDGTYSFTQTLAVDDEIKFLDTNNNYYGGNGSNNNLTASGTNLDISTSGNNFVIKTAGHWTFTVNPSTLKMDATVTKDPALYLVGTMNSWTVSSASQFNDNGDGTFSKTLDLWVPEEFGFKNEWGTWIGASIPAANPVQVFWVEGTNYSNVELLNTSDGKNFLVKRPGNYTITVNPTTLRADIVCNTAFAEAWYLKGTYDSWGDGDAFTNNGDGTYSLTKNLEAGVDVKFYSTFTEWYGYDTPIGAGVTNRDYSAAGGNISIAIAGEWTFTLNPSAGKFTAFVDASRADGYYFVSELSNNQKWECFRLSPSRNRNGGSNSGQFYTIHIQDFLMDAEHNSQDANYSALHWYIESTAGKKYYPYSNYELGQTDNNNNNKGVGVIYEPYGTLSTDGTPAYKFTHTKNYANSQSFTVFFNADYDTGGNDGEVAILINPTGNYCGKQAINEDGYYLIGNFDRADADNELKPWDPDFRRMMSKYYYKDGLQYTSEIASADSIVYRVTVERPAEGWRNLFLVVFPSSNIITDNTAWPDDGTKYNNWKQAIRPQVQWWNGLDNSGLDGTARRGGLYSRRNDSDDVQGALNPQVSDDYKSYTFSMNETTSTYNIVFNKQLYLMGPAVTATSANAVASSNADDSSASSAAWSSDHPALETTHALIFVRHAADNSYRYYGGSDTETTEQTVHLVQGQRMAFVWDKNFQDAFYAEDDVTPVSLVNASGALNINDYSKASNDKGNYDTQFVNYLSIYALPKSTFDPAVDYGTNAISGAKEYDVDGQRFNLPTGDYYIRLYITTINEKQYVYYTVGNRQYDFYSPGATTRGIKEAVFGFNEKASMRTFSDYHSVIIPSGIDVYYLSAATRTENTNKGVVTLTSYPLQTINGQSRILPANTPVFLVIDQAASAFKTTFSTPFEYYGANPKLAGPAMTNMMKPSVAAQSVPKHSDETGEAAGTTYDNFLFGYKLLDGDSKFTVGFFHPGSGTFSINSAYLQVAYDFLGDVVNDGRYFAFGPGNTTAIDAVETDTNADLSSKTIYDLQGRRMPSQAQLPKGIYVVNGKKIVVK